MCTRVPLRRITARPTSRRSEAELKRQTPGKSPLSNGHARPWLRQVNERRDPLPVSACQPTISWLTRGIRIQPHSRPAALDLEPAGSGTRRVFSTGRVFSWCPGRESTPAPLLARRRPTRRIGRNTVERTVALTLPGFQNSSRDRGARRRRHGHGHKRPEGSCRDSRPRSASTAHTRFPPESLSCCPSDDFFSRRKKRAP
jgi:hypothetical protein